MDYTGIWPAIILSGSRQHRWFYCRGYLRITEYPDLVFILSDHRGHIFNTYLPDIASWGPFLLPISPWSWLEF